MWRNIEDRVIACAEYIVRTGCTVRECAKEVSSSKSTVHKDVTERLQTIDPALWERVQAVLSVNLKERHIRGGDATKRKYENRKKKELCSG